MSRGLTPQNICRYTSLMSKSNRTFADFLLSKLQDREKAIGRRLTIQSFADELGVSHALLSIWLSGRSKPSYENIELLASKLGPEVFDVLQRKRPDPLQLYVARNWEALPPKEQERISKIVAKYITDPIPEYGSKPLISEQ